MGSAVVEVTFCSNKENKGEKSALDGVLLS